VHLTLVVELGEFRPCGGAGTPGDWKNTLSDDLRCVEEHAGPVGNLRFPGEEKRPEIVDGGQEGTKRGWRW